MPGPDVSILLSYRNSENTLAQALRSIIGQTFENWELILIDDGSTDQSNEVVQALADERFRRYGDHICRGLAARLNEGIDYAQGDLIARMDADDISFPERLATQVAFLRDHPQIDLLAVSALLLGENDEPVGVLPAGLEHRDICRRPWLGFPMPHPTWMGRKAWFRQYRYDIKARKAQDQELLYRAYTHSQYAGLATVLLAYRYSSLSLGKSLAGRLAFLRGIATQRNWLDLLRGSSIHGAAMVRDLSAILLNSEMHNIRRRTIPATETLVSQWKTVATRFAAE
ncbi:MAG: glycosyltransferase family 2 protein [Thiobacillaceae bacterium]